MSYKFFLSYTPSLRFTAATVPSIEDKPICSRFALNLDYFSFSNVANKKEEKKDMSPTTHKHNLAWLSFAKEKRRAMTTSI